MGRSCLAWLAFCGIWSLCEASETLCKELPEAAVVGLLCVRLTAIAKLDMMVGHALGEGFQAELLYMLRLGRNQRKCWRWGCSSGADRMRWPWSWCSRHRRQDTSGLSLGSAWKGRHLRLPTHRRACKMCHTGSLGDDRHLLLECPALVGQNSISPAHCTMLRYHGQACMVQGLVIRYIMACLGMVSCH